VTELAFLLSPAKSVLRSDRRANGKPARGPASAEVRPDRNLFAESLIRKAALAEERCDGARRRNRFLAGIGSTRRRAPRRQWTKSGVPSAAEVARSRWRRGGGRATEGLQ
jgi:hypothetical protein